MLRKALTKCVGGFNLSFLALFLVAALSVALYPAQSMFGLYGPVAAIMLGALLLMLGLFYFAYNREMGQEAAGLGRWQMALVFGALLLTQVTVARALESSGYTWDNQIVLNAAATYGFSGHLTSDLVKYFVLNPNNIPLLCFLAAIFRLLHQIHIDDFLTAGALLNAVFLWLTQVLVYLVSRRLYGQKIAIVSLLFSLVLIDLSPQVSTIYTDTLALLFPIATLYFCLRLIRSRSTPGRIGLSALIGVVAMMGVLLKPTAIIAFIAVVLTGLVWLGVKPGKWKSSRVVALAGCLAAVSLTMLLTYTAFQGAENGLKILPFPASQANDNGTPPLHYLAIGMKTHHFNDRNEYGGYDPAEAVAMRSLSTVQQRNYYSSTSIKRTLAAYGPIGYLNFLALKTNWIMSDSTFYAYGQGTNTNVEFTDHRKLSGAIRSYTFVNGRHYQLFANVSQVFWLAILLLISLQLVIALRRERTQMNLYITMMRMMIAGNILFVLLFEGRSRYLFLYVPIFIVLSLYTLTAFEEAQPESIKTLSRKAPKLVDVISRPV